MLMRDFGTNHAGLYSVLCSLYRRNDERNGHRAADNRPEVRRVRRRTWSERMRGEIEKALGIKAFDIYGLSEIIGPGVASECPSQTGLHVNEDHFYPEIIDPLTGQSLLLW